ncbi:MAG: hypothetical protein NTV86_18340 [Planctomycetota bacterium]|nr:hypothetical protein [Planctomycetota bacterium]
MRLDRDDPQLLSPGFSCPAEAAPKLRIEAAFRTAQKTAQVFWRQGDKPFAADRCLDVPIIGDGRERVYEVNLAAHHQYKGIITGLRIDPVASAEKDAFVRVKAISLGR